MFYALKSKKTEKLINRLDTKRRLKNAEIDFISKQAPEVSDTIPVVKVFATETSTIFMRNGEHCLFSIGEHSEEVEALEKDTFWEIFGHYARSKLLLRTFICLLTLSSLTLFAFSVLQNICNGFIYMINQ